MLRPLCMFLISIPLAAQAPAHAFDVVTIKPSDPSAMESRIDLENGDQFVARNVTARSLVKVAYHLSFHADGQIFCRMPWFATKTFDIDAKLDETAVSEMAGLTADERFDRVRQMLQAVLAERFHLSLHHETKQIDVNLLVAAKSGVRLRVATSATPSWTGLKTPSPGHIEGRQATLGNLANALAQQPEVGGRLVTNGTGLNGKYDFTLTWAPEALAGGSPITSDAGLFTALREQLGLRMEPAKLPADVLLIDRVEMPTPN